MTSVTTFFLLLLLAALFWLRDRHPKLDQQRTLLPSPGATSPSYTEAEIEADRAATMEFLLARLKRDPEDFLAQNMLAFSMLQRLRETGSAEYLERAKSAAMASLHSVAADRNAGGLSALAQTEIAEHDFTRAADDGSRLTTLHPESLSSWGVYIDALLELGEYGKAAGVLHQMRVLGSDTAETEIRSARLLFLEGDITGARQHLFNALAFARNIPAPPRETVAWCQWQLGELALVSGDPSLANRYYHDALQSYPNYVQALASLGRLEAVQGDLSGAVALYETAVQRFPDPTFVGTLGDLYRMSGRLREAEAQYALVDQIDRLSALNGTRYNRQVALFNADHNLQPMEAYTGALREYQSRRDIYGADTLAWCALKAQKLEEAQRYMTVALRLSTPDAKLYYHAGMIAAARGDMRSSRKDLQRALALNPAFDPLQASLARKAISE